MEYPQYETPPHGAPVDLAPSPAGANPIPIHVHPSPAGPCGTPQGPRGWGQDVTLYFRAMLVTHRQLEWILYKLEVNYSSLWSLDIEIS